MHSNPQICIHGFHEVAKRITSHREVLGYLLPLGDWAPQLARMVKNLPVMQKARIWSLGWEDPLEKGMATHSSILAWRIPWTVEPGGLQSMGSHRHDWVTGFKGNTSLDKGASLTKRGTFSMAWRPHPLPTGSCSLCIRLQSLELCPSSGDNAHDRAAASLVMLVFIVNN